MTKKQLMITGISLLTAFGLVASTPAVMAQDSTASIINSGDRADIDLSSYESTKVSVDNTNVADVHQYVNTEAITGGNSAEGNINLGGGAAASIVTGAASAQVGMVVKANENKTAVTGFGGEGPHTTVDVVNTGDKFDLDAHATEKTNVWVSNYNDAFVGQHVNTKAVTGHNETEGNIGGGNTITTGGAGAVVGLNADLNHNQTLVTVGDGGLGAALNGNHAGDVSVVNTGDKFDLDADSDSKTWISVSSANYLDAFQKVKNHVVSGKNDSEGNIGGGNSIWTAPAGAAVGSSIWGNHNATFVGSWWGLLMGWVS